MYIRAQVSGQAFKDLLRFRTSSMTRPCPQMYFEESRLLLTRVEFIEVAELFAGPQRTVSYPNNRPQELVFQTNRLGMKLKFRVTGAKLNSNNDPEPIASQEGFVNVALDLIVQNGRDFLSVEVIETDFDNLLSFAGVDKEEMSNLIGAGQVELGLLAQIVDITRNVDAFLSVRHVDLGFDITSDRVELRAEFEFAGQVLPTVVAEWSQFYSNSLEPILAGGEWAFYIDKKIGTGLLSRVMTAAIDGTGKFSRDGDVSVHWDAGLPGYRLVVEGEVIDACWCAWGEIDLDVRLWAEVNFSLQNNRLRMDIRIDHKITDVAEAACCVLTAVALFPIVGLDLALKSEIAWYEYLAGLALYPTPILLLVAAIAKLSSKLAEGLPVGICEKDPNDDKHFFCEFELPELSEAASCQGAKLTVRADSLTGRGDGLLLGGRIEIPTILDPGIGVEVTGFKYTPPKYNCSGRADRPEQYSASMRVYRTSGNYDFRVCHVHVLGPFKYAAKVIVEEMTCPYTAWVTVTIGITQYDFTPVKVIVSTTHGAIHAVIPAAQPVSEEHRREADLHARIERVSRCYAKSRKWDLRWLIDPAPYINVVKARQIWTLVGIAASQTKRVEVLNEAGAPLAVVDTGAGRALRLSLIESGSTLSVVQKVASDSERLEDADLHVVQTLAGVDRELEFKTPVLAVDAVWMSPARTLIVHERERLTLYHVSECGQLLRVGVLETGGAKWVGRRGRTLYAALRDGHMLRLDLVDGPADWREERSVKMTRLARGHNCWDANEDVSGVEHPGVSLPLDARHFDHLICMGNIVGDYSKRMASIRHGYWTEESEGLLVTRMVERKLQGSGEVRMNNPVAGMVIRLRNGVLLAAGEGREKLELLRVLVREEF